MPTTKIRDVDQPKIQPNVAAFLKEIEGLNLGYTMTSAQRDKDHSAHREGSSHTHGFACDIGIKEGDDRSFIEFMFGEGFDPEKKVNGEFVRPDLTPKAVELFKKHNIRLIDERLAKGGAHYHFEAVDSTNATIVKAGGKANFSTSPRQGNTDKDMYFYGGDSGVFVQNDYNTTKEYNDTIVKGSKVNIISNESGTIDTSKTFQSIPDTVVGSSNLVIPKIITPHDPKESWNYAHELTAKIEGGISSDKTDEGNKNKVAGENMYSKTYYGLTLQAYAGMKGLKYPPASKEDFKKLNAGFVKELGGTTENPVSAKDGKNKVKSLFKKKYWDKHNLGQIKDKRVAASIYDALVNQGWSFGDKGQRNSSMLGALKRLGIDTSAGFKGLDDAIAQVNSAIELKGGDAVLDSYAQSRENSYITSTNDPDNPDRKEAARGWMNRLNDHRTDASKVDWEKLPKNTALSNGSIKKVRRDQNYNIDTSTTLSKGELQEKALKEEYEKYANEKSGEGVDDKDILSYEDYYKRIDEIGSKRARKIKRDSLKGLGPRIVKTEEKKEEEEGIVGKVDEDGNLILTPTPVAPGTTISEGGEVDFGGHIQKRKDELNKKKEEENKEKEKVYQPKELVPLGDLTEEEINNLTNEERKQYGLQPTVEVVGDKLIPLESLSDEERAALSNEERKAYGLEPLISDEEKAAREEEERLRFEKEEEKDRLHGEEQAKKLKDKWKGGDKKVETVMVDKDGDGIPDTIDADAGEPTGGPAPENQLTVSTEEQVVIDEQEKESAIETVETEEIEVLDANGNIKKITVPTIKTPTTPTTVETEGVTTSGNVVEEKPELVKPKFKDFKTSGDYMRAKMKYWKSVEDEGGENPVDFDNELDDDEIKEAVDMEQNSTVIDASKRNIFKTNGKSDIFNGILGAVNDISKGIQQELNNITKSINNKQ